MWKGSTIIRINLVEGGEISEEISEVIILCTGELSLLNIEENCHCYCSQHEDLNVMSYPEVRKKIIASYDTDWSFKCLHADGRLI